MLMLLVYVGEDIYAIDCQNIIEIIPKISLKKVSQLPPYISGLANIAGKSVPVIDLCQLIQDRPSSSFLHSRIILISENKTANGSPTIGIIGEKVVEIIDREPKDFLESSVRIKELPFLGGILNDSSRMIQLFDIEKFFHMMRGAISNEIE